MYSPSTNYLLLIENGKLEYYSKAFKDEILHTVEEGRGRKVEPFCQKKYIKKFLEKFSIKDTIPKSKTL